MEHGVTVVRNHASFLFRKLQTYTLLVRHLIVQPVVLTLHGKVLNVGCRNVIYQRMNHVNIGMVVERDLLNLRYQLLLLGFVASLLQLTKKLVNLSVAVMAIVAGALGTHNRRQVGVRVAVGSVE